MNLFSKNISKPGHDKANSDISLHNSNYLRSKYITAFTATLELFMLIIYFFKYNEFDVQYRKVYLFMYIFLFVFSLSFFCILFFNKNLENKPKTINAFVIIFAEIYLLWGVAITILDHSLYSQIIVFVTNLMFCSAAFIMRPKTFIIVISFPVVLIYIALSYVQSSYTLLLGNYVNLIIIIFASIMNNYLQYSLFKKQNIQKNEMKKISEYDELTNLYNRRTLNKYIDDYNVKENKKTLGVLMIDIDYFKKYNDCYGHIAGDMAICEVGNIINKFTNEYSGFAARYGGEEFILIFENISHELIYSISENIHREIRNKNIKHEASLCDDKLSVSIGIYYSTSASNNLWDSIKHADNALFKSKNNGRNKISQICV